MYRLQPNVRFQSLSRDSVCLDHLLLNAGLFTMVVSIPESGFCLFGLVNVVVEHLRIVRFNP